MGSVASGAYDKQMVVVKKIIAVKSYSHVGKKILKEAEIAYSLDHKNINKFLAISRNPLALMFKYECFSHTPWDLNEDVYNLEMLLEFQNEAGATHILVELMPHIMKQTVAGLEYLHKNHVQPSIKWV